VALMPSDGRGTTLSCDGVQRGRLRSLGNARARGRDPVARRGLTVSGAGGRHERALPHLGLIALALVVYLLVALLMPEDLG